MPRARFPTLVGVFHVSVYRFVAIEDPAYLREQLLAITEDLLGTILVAHEGVNGMLSGAAHELDAFEAAFRSPDLLGGAFADIAFTRTVCDVAPFRRRKIKVKSELVPLDVDGIDVPSRRADIAASDVDAAGWRALLRRDDVVIVDNRNSFEFGHGHFVGAIDPGIVDFRDFAAYVRANAEQWRATGKTIAMYCTRGDPLREVESVDAGPRSHRSSTSRRHRLVPGRDGGRGTGLVGRLLRLRRPVSARRPLGVDIIVTVPVSEIIDRPRGVGRRVRRPRQGFATLVTPR